jgi:hypothetical protein
MRSHSTLALLISSLLVLSTSDTNSINSQVAKQVHPAFATSAQLHQKNGAPLHRGSGRRELLRLVECVRVLG